MKTSLKVALASMAFTVLFAATPSKAHAEDICIPLLTCPNNPPANAPEISGSMLSTGFGLVAGVAMMVRGRRRSSL